MSQVVPVEAIHCTCDFSLPGYPLMTAPFPAELPTAPIATATPAATPAGASASQTGMAIFRFFASLKLAVILLTVLTVDLAAGTIIESTHNTAFARAHVYDSWWFSIWLAFLIINLTCAALIRYPWKPHLTGFVITHAGIITLLIGAKIGQVGGVEGLMSLHVGEPGKQRMDLIDQQWIEVGLPEERRIHQMPFQLEVDVVSAERPKVYAVPGSDLTVRVLDVRPVYEEKRFLPGGNGPAALRFVFSSQRMGQRMEEWIRVGEATNPGPIEFRFMRGLPPTPAAPAGTAPGTGPAVAPAPGAGTQVPSVESFYVFQQGGMQMKAPRVKQIGPDTGAKGRFSYTDADGKEKAQLHLEIGGHEFDFDARAIEGKPMVLPDTPYTLHVEKVYRNLHVVSGGGADDGEGPAKNPALLMRILGPLVDPAQAPAAPAEPAAGDNPHGGGSGHGGSDAAAGAPEMAGPMGQRNRLTFYLTPDGRLAYWAKSPKHGEQAGTILLNQPLSLGWSDFQIQVDQFYPSAMALTYFKPAEIGEFDPDKMDQYRRGVRCEIGYHGSTQEIWLGQQRSDSAEVLPVLFGDKTVNLRFANQTVDLGFPVQLTKFEVPRHEGTSRPRDWISHLQIGEDIAEPPKRVFMNNPANYPDNALGIYMGTSYKFSQSGASEDDPTYSGVQILRDPGWLPKWLGSLLIVLGIITMFYIKPYFHGRRMALAEAQPPSPANAATASAAQDILRRAKAVRPSTTTGSKGS